jgi:UDP-N-acetylglucosamine/UDP-N-acetylgalactosamine 4-epimerase
MYEQPFHKGSIESYRFLITGGAGFIGSNLVEYLIKYKAGTVRVLDDLSGGKLSNLNAFEGYPGFEFIQGDICDPQTCRDACKGMDFVSHQAALGSVPRSVKDPLRTNAVNISGFLNVLNAASQEPAVKRMVYAASSSTYGDSKELPKVENRIGKPLSPYAVTKLVNELYGDVFSKLHGFHSAGLRYFNVFGPKQDPENPYAAVIPLFMKAVLSNQAPLIHGDGEQTRDFTFVENVVQANILAMLEAEISQHEVFNVAYGQSISLNQLWQALNELTDQHIAPEYDPPRQGDIRNSLADVSKARTTLGYEPGVDLLSGLKITLNWYKNNCII